MSVEVDGSADVGHDFIGRDQAINYFGRMANEASPEDLANIIRVALFGDKRINFPGMVDEIDQIKKQVERIRQTDARLDRLESEVLEIRNQMKERHITSNRLLIATYTILLLVATLTILSIMPYV